MMRFFRFLIALVLALVVMVVALRVAFPLPDIEGRESVVSIPASTGTELGAATAAAGAQHPGRSGVLPLDSGKDALASRLALIAAAEQSIDAQYYIWHGDTSGMLMFDALLDAARRGVRVRLLLDDNGVPGLDGVLAALDAEENFEIRLFNPSTVRSPKLMGYAFDFFRMNRRMHNKALIVDGAAAIIGGRNIGDEYFAVVDEDFYLDMDVLAVGTIVPETAAVFDQYWNSRSVFALDTIVTEPGDIAAFEVNAAAYRENPEGVAVLERQENTTRDYRTGRATLDWTTVQIVADDPVKGQGIARANQLMINRLSAILGDIERGLDLASAYFVPGETGTQFFTSLAQAGKDVRIVTNALDTTDVLMVHAGYTRYRRDLLEAGVRLYELKLRGGEKPEAGAQLFPLGLSGASLHAKTFAVDDARIFIGSFNFDPRSALLNCEMGFLIDSPELARWAGDIFDDFLTDASYRPMLTPEGKMVWQETRENGSTVIYQEEPGATWLQQATLAVIGALPIEWML